MSTSTLRIFRLRIFRGSLACGSACLLACLFACATLLAAQSPPSPNASPIPSPILLWPSGALGAAGETPLDKPTLTPYLPAQNPTHTAIVVCPGGGYAMLAIDKEGTEVAHWLNARGLKTLKGLTPYEFI